MRHPQLKLRMVVVGTILFGFYAGLAAIALSMFGVSTASVALVAVGTVLFVGVQYKIGKWAALRGVGAQDLPDEGRTARVHRMVEDVARDMGVEKPRLMVARMGAPNAFATGRKGAGVIVVSESLLATLERDELEGVLAHEMAHLRNRDVVTMVVGQSIASMVGIAVYFAVILAGDNDFADIVVGWIASTLSQLLIMLFVLAISRYREYVADADAAEYLGTGEPLAGALAKIKRANEGAGATRVDDSTAALCIFDAEDGLLKRLFATHPSTEKRIRRLREH